MIHVSVIIFVNSLNPVFFLSHTLYSKLRFLKYWKKYVKKKIISLEHSLIKKPMCPLCLSYINELILLQQIYIVQLITLDLYKYKKAFVFHLSLLKQKNVLKIIPKSVIFNHEFYLPNSMRKQQFLHMIERNVFVCSCIF